MIQLDFRLKFVRIILIGHTQVYLVCCPPHWGKVGTRSNYMFSLSYNVHVSPCAHCTHTHTQCTCILIANHQLQMRIEEMIGTINISISIRFSFILPHSTRTKRNVTQFFIKIQANSLNVGASFGVHTEWACRTRLVRQDFALFS